MTKVVFRKWKDGEVIALFPDNTNPYDGTVMSYMHIGQYGDADYGHVISAHIRHGRVNTGICWPN